MMSQESTPESWRRLLRLLEPIEAQAAATARRLSRGPADGDDLFHDAVLRAHHKLDTLRDEMRFRPWFYSILLSIHRNRWRGSFWRRFLALDDPALGGWEPKGTDGSLWESERSQAERASRALGTLPPVQREAIVLFEIDGFAIEEIAVIQKVSLSAVKSRLARGRDRLRRHYEKLGIASRDAVLNRAARLPLSEGRKS